MAGFALVALVVLRQGHRLGRGALSLSHLAILAAAAGPSESGRCPAGVWLLRCQCRCCSPPEFEKVYSQCRPEAAQLHWQVQLEVELELEVCHDGPVAWCAAINRGDRDWPSLVEREREARVLAVSVSAHKNV